MPPTPYPPPPPCPLTGPDLLHAEIAELRAQVEEQGKQIEQLYFCIRAISIVIDAHKEAAPCKPQP
jgi:hypothetical protein